MVLQFLCRRSCRGGLHQFQSRVVVVVEVRDGVQNARRVRRLIDVDETAGTDARHEVVFALVVGDELRRGGWSVWKRG